MIRSAWDLLVHAATTAPVWVWPMLGAWVIAVGATQAIKQSWLREDLPPKVRHRATQLLAVVFALVASWTLWPAELHWKHGIAVGAAVGLWAPASYALAMKIVGHRWPWLRERLSGDRATPGE